MIEIIVAALAAILAPLIVYSIRDDIKQFIHAQILIRRPFRANTIRSLSEILGVDQNVKRLLIAERNRNGKDYFAIGNCIELTKSSNLQNGWFTDKLSCVIDPEPFKLVFGFQRLCDEWKQNNPKNPDKKRYILSDIIGQNTSDAPFIQFKFRESTFGKIFPIESSLDKSIEIEESNYGVPRKRFVSQLLSLSESPIPNCFGFHIIAKTTDGYIVFGQRSKYADYYPNLWSASCEEQMAEEDFSKANPFVGGVRRALEEEFGIPAVDEGVHVRLLSVFLEYDVMNTNCCAVADVHLTSEELKQRWFEIASDKEEAAKLTFISSDFETLVRSLLTGELNVDGKESITEEWHPTTKYRLFMFCASEYGIFRLQELIKRIYLELDRQIKPS